MTFVEQEIKRLRNRLNSVGLDEDDYVSLMEYEGRLQSIEAERDFLNGERNSL